MSCQIQHIRIGFNSRSRKGATDPEKLKSIKVAFQFTLP
ncbi:hypothetical protein HMPREF1221_01576 [Treponema socranskii subsp. paredis ATCC 35535]|nr:hypothetical protein HMPREF1221_01576 [Treponema socranskii subsp. paredis ATCC 35535]